MANKRLSVTDIQLIHRLVKEYHLTQMEVADIVGCTQSAVCKALKKPISHIEDTISFSDTYPMDNGCYRTVWSHSDSDGYSVYQQSIDPYEDPTFQAVADWEEAGED